MRAGCLPLVLAAVLGCASDPTPSAPEQPEPEAPAPGSQPEPEAPEPEPAPELGMGTMVEEFIEDARVPDDLRRLPAGPTLLIGLNLAAFVAKPQWRTIATQLGPREREQLRATEACGVGPQQWRRVLLGLDPPHQAAIVVEAAGVGKPSTLRCLHDEIGTFDLAPDAKTMRDVTGGGIVLDEDTIVFATSRWMDPLRERLEDRGSPAYDGALKQATARAGFGHAAWLGMIPPPDLQGLITTTIGSEVKDLSGSIDVTPDGYTIEVSLTAPNTMMAALRVQGQLAMFEGLAEANGIPSAILDTATVAQQDGRVLISLSATNQQVEELITAVRDRF